MDNIINIYLNLIANPFPPKVYRELQKHYHRIGNKDAEDAFSYVIDVKFPNHTDIDLKQPGDHRSLS